MDFDKIKISTGGNMKQDIYMKMSNHNENLSRYACLDKEAIYLRPNHDDIRTPFLGILIVLFIHLLLFVIKIKLKFFLIQFMIM